MAHSELPPQQKNIPHISEEKSTPNNKKLILYALAVIFVSFLFHTMRFNLFPTGAFQDDAHYVMLAEALATGQGYVLPHEPTPRFHGEFPPGWPLLLTPISLMIPGQYDSIKLMTSFFWLGSLFLIIPFYLNRLPPVGAFICFALVAINPELIFYSTTLMAEISFLFFTFLVFYLLDQVDYHKPIVYHLVLICVLAFFAQLVRTIGITLFASAIIWIMFNLVKSKKYQQSGIIFGVGIVLMLMQIAFNANAGGAIFSQGYEQQVFTSSLYERLGQVFSNAREYAAGKLTYPVLPLMSQSFSDWLWARNLIGLKHLYTLAFLTVLAVGFISRLIKFSILELYLILYTVGVLSFWNPVVGSAQMRFVIPLVPFLIYYFVVGGSIIIGKFKNNQAKKNICSILVFLLVIVSITRNIEAIQHPIRNYFTDLSIGRIWIQKNAPLDSIIMTPNPIPDYLYVRRKTISYPIVEAQVQQSDFELADYVLIAPPLKFPPATELSTQQQQQFGFLSLRDSGFTLAWLNAEKSVYVFRRNP